jgi:acyl-ACP thioesterase
VDDLEPEPAVGRVFRASRRVRLSDADPSGRLRFDAVARYLHDVSNDDTRDSGLRDDGSWVVRRTAVSVVSPLRFLETVELATWCSATGPRWAERRVSLIGARGGRVEAAALWVYVDLQTMMPKRLGADFLDLYGPSAGGRTIGSKLELPGPPAGAERRPWPLRRTDLDVLDHVNNAAYWEAVEEFDVGGPCDAVLEFAKPISWGSDVDLVVQHDPLTIWFEVAGTVHATARATPS